MQREAELLDDRAAFLAQYAGARFEPVEADLTAPITGFIGRDPANDAPALNVVGGERPNTPRGGFKIVSFYTLGNGYEVHAARLRDSLDRLGLAYAIEPVEDAAGWEAVCARKSLFVLDQWRRSDVPVVWIDADAVVERTPQLFAAIDADFAAHRWTWEPNLEDFGFELCSGTLYFGKTELAGKLLEQWALRCAADPDTWDQRHLESAWCDISALHPLRTVWLPRAYLQIDGARELSAPVVRHLQASRAEKARRPRAQAPQFALSPIGVEDRRRNRLWRSYEQAFWITQGVDHIIPDVGDDFPEGFDVRAVLDRCLGADATVLEFGCGVGRIASLFEPRRYIGVDVNPSSVALARRRNPGHHIRTWDGGLTLPAMGGLLFYTVLLHVSDEALKPLLSPVLGGLCAGQSQVVIAELMDRRWRRDGVPPVFNRDPEDYIVVMDAMGFDFVHHEKHAYARYDAPPWNVGRDSRMTFLKFTSRMEA